MKRICLVLSILFVLSINSHVCAESETTFFQLSIVHPVQLFQQDNVKGFRANFVYGYNQNVTGLDAGLFNFVENDMIGVQIGGINCSYNMTGIQAGLYNSCMGIQLSDTLVEKDEGIVKGLQAGVFNTAGHLHGMQLGIFNFAEKVDGLQVGFTNVEHDSKYFLLPLVRFNRAF